MTLKEIADDMNFKKVDGLWYSEFYLNLLDCTPYHIGAEVYLSDGVYHRESGLTGAELKEMYKKELEMRNE
jgi:hypothetical protein